MQLFVFKAEYSHKFLLIQLFDYRQIIEGDATLSQSGPPRILFTCIEISNEVYRLDNLPTILFIQKLQPKSAYVQMNNEKLKTKFSHESRSEKMNSRSLLIRFWFRFSISACILL